MPAGLMKSTERIHDLDALRGFALCGIYLYNIILMGGPIGFDMPLAEQSIHHPDWQVWWASQILVNGTMRGLFSLLYGISMVLFLTTPERSGLFLKRSFWLFLFGLFNAYVLLWPGDILTVYAVAGLLILPFCDLAPNRQLILAVVLFVVLTVWSVIDAGSPLTPTNVVEVRAALEAERAARLGGYGDVSQFMVSEAHRWIWVGKNIWWVIDAAAMMLVGMALYRLQWLTGQSSRKTLPRLLALGMCLGVPLRVLSAVWTWKNGGVMDIGAWAIFQPGRLFMTLFWAALFLLFWHRLWHVFGAGLAALGRMAFTGYLAQSLIALVIFSGFGFGLYDQLSWAARWALVFVIMFTLAIFAHLWLARFRMGPMEWAWRCLTYAKALPIKNARPQTPKA